MVNPPQVLRDQIDSANGADSFKKDLRASAVSVLSHLAQMLSGTPPTVELRRDFEATLQEFMDRHRAVVWDQERAAGPGKDGLKDDVRADCLRVTIAVAGTVFLLEPLLRSRSSSPSWLAHLINDDDFTKVKWVRPRNTGVVALSWLLADYLVEVEDAAVAINDGRAVPGMNSACQDVCRLAETMLGATNQATLGQRWVLADGFRPSAKGTILQPSPWETVNLQTAKLLAANTNRLVTVDDIELWADMGLLLFVENWSGEKMFPKFQFSNLVVMQVIGRIVPNLDPSFSGWPLFYWFIRRLIDFQGRKGLGHSLRLPVTYVDPSTGATCNTADSLSGELRDFAGAMGLWRSDRVWHKDPEDFPRIRTWPGRLLGKTLYRVTSQNFGPLYFAEFPWPSTRQDRARAAKDYKPLAGDRMDPSGRFDLPPWTPGGTLYFGVDTTNPGQPRASTACWAERLNSSAVVTIGKIANLREWRLKVEDDTLFSATPTAPAQPYRLADVRISGPIPNNKMTSSKERHWTRDFAAEVYRNRYQGIAYSLNWLDARQLPNSSDLNFTTRINSGNGVALFGVAGNALASASMTAVPLSGTIKFPGLVLNSTYLEGLSDKSGLWDYLKYRSQSAEPGIVLRHFPGEISCQPQSQQAKS